MIVGGDISPRPVAARLKKRGRRIMRKVYRRRTSSRSGSQIKPVFAQVLMSCDAKALNLEV